MIELAFFDIGFGEMVVVGFVALLLFGGRLPEVMRTLGGSYRKFRSGMDELTRQSAKVMDVRSSLPPYQPTPPASTPVTSFPPAPPPMVPATEDPTTTAAAGASDAGPVAESAPTTSDDPPPV